MSNLLFASITKQIQDATWSPKKALQARDIDYDRVVRAINFRYMANWRNGLCFTFESINTRQDNIDAYNIIPRLLVDLNDRTDLLPSYDYENEQGFDFEGSGNNQRLMLLAFMLTWLENKDD